MCSRKEARAAQIAQDAAAEALTAACVDCVDNVSASLRAVYQQTLKEGVPDKFRELLGRLQ